MPIDEAHGNLTFCETQDRDALIQWLWREAAPEGYEGTQWLSVVFYEDSHLNVVNSLCLREVLLGAPE
ncbi:hypothetical protein [Nesterenkonia natronophila]|uniref:Uncharacterized protein n=1 Tax=Nesterenkonia natronophila TaxID=2174932 RepID=A0A3A4F4B2_9MICC|nr:hypothetical protein [Nesterenkonia natronophila]RJN32656.1 hypothetical protein D3250_02160 [Nesterenkonia natronophila]